MTAPAEAFDILVYGLNPRRSSRYVVMPYATDYVGGKCTTRYGILDCMITRADAPASCDALWCALPGEDGDPEVLLWPTAGAAGEWLRRCLEIRQREGGPASYLPFGWYGPREVSGRIRAAFSPWEGNHPPGAPLHRREEGV